MLTKNAGNWGIFSALWLSEKQLPSSIPLCYTLPFCSCMHLRSLCRRQKVSICHGISHHLSSPLSLPALPYRASISHACYYCYYLAAVGRVIHKLGGAGDRFGDYLCADCPFLPCVSRRSQLINTKFTKHITNISKSSCRQTVLGHCCYTVPPCVCLQGDYVW